MLRTRGIAMISALLLTAAAGLALANSATGASPTANPSLPPTHSRSAPASTARPSSTAGSSAMVACPDMPAPGAAPGTTGSGTAGVGTAGAGTAGVGTAEPDIAAPDIAVSDAGSATHLFTRTTADAVTIRVYRLPDPVVACDALPQPLTSSATSSLACASTSVSVEMSDATAVGQGDLFTGVTDSPSPTTPDAGTEPRALSTGTFGVVEGDPVWWLAARVGPDVATAAVTFADGSTDQMAPVGGLVVLAHHLAPGRVSDPDTVAGTLTLADAHGHVLRTVALAPPAVNHRGPVPVPPPGPVIPVPVAEPNATGGAVAGTASVSPSIVMACPLTGGAGSPPPDPSVGTAHSAAGSEPSPTPS